jgi:antitoxin (DNA-binding transcriptional repressor) of toxin-antitoxin stability system
MMVREGETGMSTKIIDLQESTANLQELLSLVREGTELILTDGDLPLARLVPMTAPQRIPDLFPGGWISDDFDESLPEEFWPGTDID